MYFLILGISIAALQFLGVVWSDQVVLMSQPTDGVNSWFWTLVPHNNNFGWSRVLGGVSDRRPRYSACHLGLSSSDPKPDNWLISPRIHVNEAKRIDVTIEYVVIKCSTTGNNGGYHCENVFDLYVSQSNQASQYPDPRTNKAAYEKVTELENISNDRTLQTTNIRIKGTYIFLAFHNYGACCSLFSVKVSYNICPGQLLCERLVSLPRTVAPVNDHESIPVEGHCMNDSFEGPGSLYVYCELTGEWNTSKLEGRCICKENMQKVGGKCQGCPDGKYNDQKGLDCTVLPSAPNSVDATFVNQCAVKLSWQPPKITGDQSHVFYDVQCRKLCNSDDGSKCVEAACGSKVGYIPGKEGLNYTQVMAMNLGPFVIYTFKIYARNRVSEVARRTHGFEGNFASVTVRTMECGDSRNPYRTTSATGGIRTMKQNDVSFTSYIAVATTLGVGLFIVLVLLGVLVKRQRTVQRRLPVQNLENVQAAQANVAQEMENIGMDVVAVTNTSDTMNNFQYMDIVEINSFELERNDIRFERLLGSGNFGEVYKATMGNKTVAVKCLKETATAKDKHDMLTELNVMKGLKSHPHVLKLMGCCSLSDPLLIVLEYLPYGDLLGYLRKSRGHSDRYNSGEKNPTSRLTAKDLLSFAWMIADGMKYLANMKIVHRDLAARNILVGENKVCKISDFGLARDINVDIYVRSSQARLPVKWMPPESLFLGESSTMSDVWSYGIVLWEVFTIGDSPYPGVKGREVASLLERGYRMPRPIHISKELFSIMSECWSEKPEDRPTFQWICAAMKRLINDQKCYVNLDVYNDKDYINFDMFDELQ